MHNGDTQGERNFKSREQKTKSSFIHLYDVIAISIIALASSSIKAKDSILWSRNLLQEVPLGHKLLKEDLNKPSGTVEFMGFSSIDSLQVWTMASCVLMRQDFWLCHWDREQKLKSCLSAVPFQRVICSERLVTSLET